MLSVEERAEANYHSAIYTAYEEGVEEGSEKGREEGRKEGRKEGLEKGRKEGLEEGRKEGLEEGKIRKGIRDAANIVTKLHCTIEKAMEIIELDSKYRKDVISELQKMGISIEEE